jgi:MFS family permease
MTAAPEATAPGAIRSLIPARIDRLPWSPFHTRMVVALGVAWILDGLEITVASAVVAQLTSEDTLALSSTQAGLLATVYLAGEVVGALFFGRLSDSSAGASCSSSPWPSTWWAAV